MLLYKLQHVKHAILIIGWIVSQIFYYVLCLIFNDYIFPQINRECPLIQMSVMPLQLIFLPSVQKGFRNNYCTNNAKIL